MEKNKHLLNVAQFSVASSDNPDLLKFSAVVGYLDTPTDGTPCGGLHGYKTIISSEGTNVQTLAGMGVNVSYGWNDNFKGHDPWFKIGTINSVSQVGNEIHAEGHLWKSDFPDICDTIECAKESLGCSVEVYFESVEIDDDAHLIVGKQAHFTGVAILYKSKAAFKKTSIMCSLMDTKGEDEMSEEVKQALEEQSKISAEQFAAVNEAIAKLTETVNKLAESKAEKSEENDGKVELSKAIKAAIADGVKVAFSNMKEEGANPATRKTAQDFESLKQKDEPKSYMELCAEIDADKTLSDGQKWAKKLAIWQNRDEAE